MKCKYVSQNSSWKQWEATPLKRPDRHRYIRSLQRQKETTNPLRDSGRESTKVQPQLIMTECRTRGHKCIIIVSNCLEIHFLKSYVDGYNNVTRWWFLWNICRVQSNFLTWCPIWARVFSLISQSPVTSAGLSTLSSNADNDDAGRQDARQLLAWN